MPGRADRAREGLILVTKSPTNLAASIRKIAKSLSLRTCERFRVRLIAWLTQNVLREIDCNVMSIVDNRILFTKDEERERERSYGRWKLSELIYR